MVKSQKFNPPLEKVIEEFLPRINHLANKYAYLGQPVLSKEDLVSAGIIGLIEAYHRFDPGKKVNFRTFAEYRIRGAILDELRKVDNFSRTVREKATQLEEKIKELHDKLGRMPEEEEIAKFLGITVEEYYKLLEEIKGISFVDINYFKQKIPEFEEDIFEFLNIPSQEKDPFDKIFWKDLQEKLEKALDTLSEKERLILALYYYEDLTMKEIANILGYTEGRISQLHNQALLKLRSFLKDKI